MPAWPEPCDMRDLKTLLRRCALCSKLGAEDSGAGVWKMDAPGAKLFRPLLAPRPLLVELRCIDWKPSARLVPEEERWKRGWLGRPGARDILEPLCDRAWLGGNCCCDCCILFAGGWRFMADDGIGMADMLLLTGARLCARGRQCLFSSQDGESEGAAAIAVAMQTYLAWSLDREHSRLVGHYFLVVGAILNATRPWWPERLRWYVSRLAAGLAVVLYRPPHVLIVVRVSAIATPGLAPPHWTAPAWGTCQACLHWTVICAALLFGTVSGGRLWNCHLATTTIKQMRRLDKWNK